MSGVQTIPVTEDEDGLRVDRWFKRRFPGLGHGRLEKLLRTGQVRVDGGRCKSNTRLESGQEVRVPPLPFEASKEKKRRTTPHVSSQDLRDIQDTVLHIDRHVIAINKPPGLAVQGGTGTAKHVDALLDGLRFDGKERPRLVHRLDKDTSGVLLLARSAKSAAMLGDAFRSKEARKVYWAIVAGVPRPAMGRMDLSLEKRPGRGGEKMTADEEGRRAITDYKIVANAARKASWLVLEPVTGRTHQLRVHCEAIGTPILGDGKYGGRDAFIAGDSPISRKLHLHARGIQIPNPGGGILEVIAPLPDHMVKTWRYLEFDERDEAEPFLEWRE
jgi:23S rRNA pseudouridine955/2504/2580 synthase